jgi:hypothetical protein
MIFNDSSKHLSWSCSRRNQNTKYIYPPVFAIFLLSHFGCKDPGTPRSLSYKETNNHTTLTQSANPPNEAPPKNIPQGLLKAKNSVGNIHFDHLIPDEHHSILEQDLNSLRKISFIDSKNGSKEGEMTQLMELPNISNTEIVKWFEDRIHYIVDVSFMRAETPEFNIMADNLGIILYLKNMENAFLHENSKKIIIPGHGSVKIDSPRSGIIRLGPSFFRHYHIPFPRVNTRIRLATLAHEGKHSDGIDFLHVKCPKDHSIADQFACDSITNGSYSIGAQFLKSTLNGCSECNPMEKEMIRLVISDYLGRIIKQ